MIFSTRQRGGSATVAAMVAAGLFLAACESADRPGGSPTSAAGAGAASASAGVPSVSSAASGTYKEVAKPCSAVKLAALENVLGPAKDADEAGRTRSARGVTRMECTRRIGDAGTVIVQIEVFDEPVAAEAQYQGLRGVHQGEATVADIPGVGQGAYSRVDKVTDPHVVVYDGNLHFEIGAGGPVAGTAPAQRVFDAMVAVAREAMTALKS